jgi:hypothetical protein
LPINVGLGSVVEELLAKTMSGRMRSAAVLGVVGKPRDAFVGAIFVQEIIIGRVVSAV